MLDDTYLYYPTPWEERDWAAESGLPLEEVWLATEDHTRVFGWYVEAPKAPAVLIWSHGNAGNISDRLPNMVELHRRGLSMLIFDYRGYGRSQGRPSEEGLYQDAQAAYRYVRAQRQVGPERLILFGTSLGAAVAGELARTQPAAGLILETPFPSVEAVARSVYFGLPVHLLLKARFELSNRLKQVRMPLLVLHGDRDTIIPFTLGQEVYEAANQPKGLYRIEGADHNNTYEVGGEAYFDQILGFIRRVTLPGQPP